MLASVLDNKYLKRRSQIELQRRHEIEMARCGGSDSLMNHPIFHITNPNHRPYTKLMLVVFFLAMCSFWFLAGWMMSALYTTSSPVISEQKSLQDLADSIQRMRLRRAQAIQEASVDDEPPSSLVSDEDEKLNEKKRHNRLQQVHYYHSHMDLPEPKNEFDLLKSSEENEADRIQKLEQRIRATQDRTVKEELKAKRLDDTMAQSIQALRRYAHEDASVVKLEDVEEESFSG